MATDHGGRENDDDAIRAHRVLRAIWVIVSASQSDAVARDVAEMGERLRAAIERGDRGAAEAAVTDVRAWLSTMAGVVASRMVQAFEPRSDAPGGGDRRGRG
jgi:D-serine deaminase-like pyridoxal phosphate-dependent protein